MTQSYAAVQVSGALSYQVSDTTVTFSVGRIVNDSARATGPLRLELWALTAPFNVRNYRGFKIGERVLPALKPRAAYRNVTGRGTQIKLPTGRHYTTLLLKEQVQGQWVVRNHYNFPNEPVAALSSNPAQGNPPAPAASTSSSSSPSSSKGIPLGAGITYENVQHNLNQLNAYRAKAGAPPLTIDAQLSAFAYAGTLELMRNHIPHNHFKRANIWQSGFRRGAAENQGDPNGWRPVPTNTAIDQMLKMMMDEGPGGGHHDNILNPAFRRVGIGLAKDARGRLYLTNDFSQ